MTAPRTLDGCPFDPAEPVWCVRTPTAKLRFTFELPRATLGFRDALREAIGRQLHVDRPEYALETLKRVRVLVRHAASRRHGQVDTLDLADFLSYRDSLAASSRYLAAVALDCLRSADAFGFQRLTPELRESLTGMQVVVVPRSSPSNVACPRRGPLTVADLRRVAQELDAAYEAGRLRFENYALALLMLGLMPRPGQAALLKVRDLVVARGPTGGQLFSITMPTIKVARSAAPPGREPPRSLHPNLGAALARQSAEAVVWGTTMGIPPAECPLFPGHHGGERSAGWPDLPWTVGHASASAISVRVTSTFQALDLSSIRAAAEERTITATRLRRSVATIGRGKGMSYEQVGKLLWHHGPGTAHIYSGPDVGVIKRVEQAIDFRAVADLYARELSAARQGGRAR